MLTRAKPTTGGAISEADPSTPTITHTCDLVERHRITILADHLPGKARDRVAVARMHAEAYARARGFEIKAGSFDVLNGSTLSPGSAFNGVAFEVTVGKGDIALDQRMPGVLDHWTWSAGVVEWWQRFLGRLSPGDGGKLLSLVDGKGKVRTGRITGMRPVPGDPGAVSVEGEFVDGSGGFHGIGDPSRMPGDWRGPAALQGLGLGTEANVDQRPPWMRRADGDDTEGDS